MVFGTKRVVVVGAAVVVVVTTVVVVAGVMVVAATVVAAVGGTVVATVGGAVTFASKTFGVAPPPHPTKIATETATTRNPLGVILPPLVCFLT